MNPRSAGLLAIAALIASALSVSAADCSSQDGDRLLKEEEQVVDSLRDCARMDPRVANDGGPEGECVASPRGLDVAEAADASCMSKEQMSRFDNLSYSIDMNCLIIEYWKVGHNYVLDAQCHRDRTWLSAFRAEQDKERGALMERQLRTPADLLEMERSREDDLQACSHGSKEAILNGEMADGVCSGYWSYLSPAEAAAAPRMSGEELKQFRALSYSYQASCAALSEKLGDKAHASNLCGADWSWLEGSTSAGSAKNGLDVGRALGDKPY
jgi:hypothetical protein